MNCAECEGAIFVYRELNDVEKQQVDEHIATCASCRKIFNEVERVNQLVAKAAHVGKQARHLVALTDKIMAEVAHQGKSGRLVPMTPSAATSSIARYSLAAVSVGMLIMFFMEVFAPSSDPVAIQGPIHRLQSAVVNSGELRKAFSAHKERKRSLLVECINPLSKQTDQACLKEKLKKLTF